MILWIDVALSCVGLGKISWFRQLSYFSPKKCRLWDQVGFSFLHFWEALTICIPKLCQMSQNHRRHSLIYPYFWPHSVPSNVSIKLQTQLYLPLKWKTRCLNITKKIFHASNVSKKCIHSLIYPYFRRHWCLNNTSRNISPLKCLNNIADTA